MNTPRPLRFIPWRWLPLLVLAFGAAAASAQQAVDPPARVASLSQMDGSVAFAPAGESEWADAVLNRPITRGDRLWTDRGARAELHLGSAVLHIDEQTFLDITDLDDDVMQAALNEGTVNARVRELVRGENFEIDTPQLAFRASAPGDYRIDVDPARGTTRVTVRGGSALVYGASGREQEIAGGQMVTFAGTNLERVDVQAMPALDGFDRWAADRNRAEDESIAARYVPRDVVGYHQLDPYGNWAQEASYGTVWYPRITVRDWAPYRYGHWEYIAPWGWTWIDDAPWGFAPFHYGRWAMIGSRWAWVPGRIGPRPVYAPALVAFVGGGGGVSFSLTIGSGPGIGWFPLAPGEAWRPYYRTSPRYVTSVNRYIMINNQVTNNYVYINQRRPSAVTAVGLEDFSRSRPVHRNRRQLDAGELDRVRIATQPTLPEARRIVESRPSRTRALPPPTLSSLPAQPRPQAPGPAARRRDGDDQRPIAVPRPQLQDQHQVQREQERAAREHERSSRDQQLQQERSQRAQRDQQMQVLRQQDEQRRQQQVQREQERSAREQERGLRELDRARREQQLQQERAQRDQALRENALRQQRQAQETVQRQQQAAQEQAVRQQPAAQEQGQQRQQQQRASRQQAQPQVAPAPEAPPPRERGRGKPEREQRDDNRSPGGEEGGRGRGQGRGG